MFPSQDRENTSDDPVAARAGEAEDIASRHIEVARQRFAQESSRAEEAGADGRRRDSQRIRRFLHRHLLDFAKGEDRAEGNRQLVNPVFEHASNLGAQGRGGRGLRLLVREFCLLVATAPEIVTLEGDHDSLALLLAQTHQRLVGDDADEPGAELCLAAK